MSWWRRTKPPASQDPACDLMQRYCDGDAAAFRDLYRLLAPVALADLTSRGCTGQRAAEVLEAAFLTLHRDRDLYVRAADPRPWLLAIARRYAAAASKRAAADPVAQRQALST